MDYNEYQQEKFYSERLGKVYGCFEVIGVEYDPEIRKQVWTMRCIHCGMVKRTHNGKDYVKGKNHGICKCQHTKKMIPKKIPKIKKELMQDHELYSRWDNIKSRCFYEKDPGYHNYGGRGISMCDEWRYNFWEFVRWAESHGYRKDLTIDRIDVNGNYCPENCRWIPRGDQNKNKRNVPLYENLTLPDYCHKYALSYKAMAVRIRSGMSLEEARRDVEGNNQRADFLKKCREAGVKPETVEARMKKGWSEEEALSGKSGTPYEIGGVRDSFSGWCKRYGMLTATVSYRMKHGMSLEEALTTDKKPGRPFKK